MFVSIIIFKAYLLIQFNLILTSTIISHILSWVHNKSEMLKKYSKDAVKDMNKNAYYSDNEEVKADHIKYYAVLMHTEFTDIITDLDQFLVTEISYCCIFIMFEIVAEWKFNLQIWVIMKENDAENKIIIIRLECTVIEDDKITALLLSSENLFSSIKNISKMQQINIDSYIY